MARTKQAEKRRLLEARREVPADPFAEVERLRLLVLEKRREYRCEQQYAESALGHVRACERSIVRHKAEAEAATDPADWAAALKRQRDATTTASERLAKATRHRARAEEHRAAAEKYEAELTALRPAMRQTVTIEEVGAVCREYCKKTNDTAADSYRHARVYQIFAKYGANNIRELKSEYYAAVIAEINGPVAPLRG